MNIKIKGYNHIAIATDEANRKLDKIRKGNITPLVTLSDKETEALGGFWPEDQRILAGRSGTGKTAKLLHDITDFCDPLLNPYYHNKLIVLYDTWEMSEWRNALRMYSREVGLTVQQLTDWKKKLSDDDYKRVVDVTEKLNKLPIFFNSYSKSVAKWEEEKENIAALFPNHFLLLVVDHTRLATKDKESKEEELITNLMVAGMRIKRKISSFNYFLSQLNRKIEEGTRDMKEIGKRLPIASDLFGSDAVFQTADTVTVLHRPGMYGLENFEVIMNGQKLKIPTGKSMFDTKQPDNLLLQCILKNRDAAAGQLITMKHDLARNRFTDYDLDELDL